jgi:hypothetical protein
VFRRQLYYGITIILLVTLIFLILRGRSEEKELDVQNIKLEEVVSEPLSPVRAILPRDLEIVETKVYLTRNLDEEDASSARHDITIRNLGGGFFIGLWLRLEYIDEQGRPVEIRMHEVNESLPPRETLRISDITIHGLPDAASDFNAAILSADLMTPQN